MKKIVLALCLAAAALIDAAAAPQWVQRPGDTRSPAKFQADCSAGIAMDSCSGVPTPSGCPAGKQWSTAGGIAHCVLLDPVCTPPAYVVHDALGNPSCYTPPPPASSTVDEYRTTACPTGYTGSVSESRTVTTTGAMVVYGNWQMVSYNCVPGSAPPNPPPTTNPPPTNPPPANPVCPNGASNYPSCTFPTTCTASDTIIAQSACPNGGSGGPLNTHAVNSCPGNVYSEYVTGFCLAAPPTTPTTPTTPLPQPTCSNGASNYPTCTLPPPPTCANGAPDYPTCTPPALPTCPNGASNYPTCTPPTLPTCANGSTNYPTCTIALPLPPACPATQITCGFEQKQVVVWTVYITTFSGPSCMANITTRGPYYENPPSDCD